MAKEADHGDGLSVTKCEEAILTEAALLDFRECSSVGLANGTLMGACFITTSDVEEVELHLKPDRNPPDARCKRYAKHHHLIQDLGSTTLCPNEDASAKLALRATLNGGFIDAKDRPNLQSQE